MLIMNNQALLKLFSELLKDNENIKVLDFTKEEDVNKLKDSVKVIKDNPFFSNFFDNDFLDDLVKKAEERYEEAHSKVPTRPSLQVPINVVTKTRDLAEKYLNTLVKPYAPNITDEQLSEIKDSLVEFACWVYKQ